MQNFFENQHAFIDTIKKVYGKKGTMWLKRLPTIIEHCQKKWNLRNLKPFPQQKYNFLLHGFKNTQPIVLKVRCDENEFEYEIASLHQFHNYAVPIYEIDHDNLAYLMKRLDPGIALTELLPKHEEEANKIGCTLLKKICSIKHKKNNFFPHLSKIITKFDKQFPEFKKYQEKALLYRNELLKSADNVLIHGDFHHDNILKDENSWIIIDSEGIYGDPGYDAALFIRNPLKKLLVQPEQLEIIKNRLLYFSNHLPYNLTRLTQWLFLQSATSLYWSIEDKLEITEKITFLNLLEKII